MYEYIEQKQSWLHTILNNIFSFINFAANTIISIWWMN